jgi:hypothetical protein
VIFFSRWRDVVSSSLLVRTKRPTYRQKTESVHRGWTWTVSSLHVATVTKRVPNSNEKFSKIGQNWDVKTTQMATFASVYMVAVENLSHSIPVSPPL